MVVNGERVWVPDQRSRSDRWAEADGRHEGSRQGADIRDQAGPDTRLLS